MDDSTPPAQGVERLPATGVAVVDLSERRLTGEMVFDGDTGSHVSFGPMADDGAWLRL